jgi:hypothetical protein
MFYAWMSLDNFWVEVLARKVSHIKLWFFIVPRRIIVGVRCKEITVIKRFPSFQVLYQFWLWGCAELTVSFPSLLQSQLVIEIMQISMPFINCSVQNCIFKNIFTPVLTIFLKVSLLLFCFVNHFLLQNSCGVFSCLYRIKRLVRFWGQRPGNPLAGHFADYLRGGNLIKVDGFNLWDWFGYILLAGFGKSGQHCGLNLIIT